MRPRYSLLTAAIALLVGLASGSVARAAVPSAANSTVDPFIVWCPGGDDTLHVVVRDFANNPQANSFVAVQFISCPEVAVCPANGTETYVYDAPSRSVRTVGDVFGRAALPVRAGGTCPAPGANVYADGVLLATRNLTSPDQNGDGFVDGTDAGLLQAKVGSADPTGDLDGSGLVDAADLAVLQAHSGHSCTGVTPTAPSTWGRVKTIYR